MPYSRIALLLAASAGLVVSAAVQIPASSPSPNSSGPLLGKYAPVLQRAQKILSSTAKDADQPWQPKPMACDERAQGGMPGVNAMISTLINHPTPGQQIEANTSFSVELTISNLFPSDETLHPSSPQRVDPSTGHTKGHVYVRIERIADSASPGLLDFVYVSRASRIGPVVSSGPHRLGVDVLNGVPSLGLHRACTVATGEGGWPVVMPATRRGPADDCVWFNVVGTSLPEDEPPASSAWDEFAKRLLSINNLTVESYHLTSSPNAHLFLPQPRRPPGPYPTPSLSRESPTPARSRGPAGAVYLINLIPRVHHSASHSRHTRLKSPSPLLRPSTLRMTTSHLFTIPVPHCDDAQPGGDAHPGGSIVCSEPQSGIYLLAWSSLPDNRLTTPFCRALLEALDALELSRPPGVLVTTSAITKFYSNGLDLAHAIATEGFWALLYSVWRRFLTYPMPTIALINGHAFAGGLMLATAHDYRLAPRNRGYLCLNELLFGAPLKPAMAAIFRHKLPPSTLRDLALEARRFDGPQAVAAGLADGLADGVDDVFAFVRERALGEKAKSGVYGVIKAELNSPLIAYLSGPGLDAAEARFEEDRRAEAEHKEFASVWYEQWRKDNKAKL
ncbi:hypothetical protein XA68_17457 [Ophiocordyceps unilateralis]|uniref:Enoyl-CoA hydratase n=1 Tax=Ophiocordyceps unilateralis TaxID=268505 RepID=A0A2A9PIT6_OPHUN|nr:hypothetical protein XA68_17457 [Ophiocordyceps unilateralis]